jgi:hypothetical protein
MIWYRGSLHNHLEFHTAGNANEQHGTGLYFTDNENTAKIYGEVSAFEISGNIIRESAKVNAKLIAKMMTLVPSDVMMECLSNWDENVPRAKKMLLDAIVGSGNMVDALQTFWIDACGKSAELFLSICRKVGIDGILIEKNDEDWLVLYSFDKARKVDLQKKASAFLDVVLSMKK